MYNWFAKKDFRSLSDSNWMCKLCAIELFPFNHIEDDDIFSNIISDQCNISLSLSIDELEKNVFETNDIDDTGFIDPLNALDQYQYYFNDFGSYTECKYYLEAGYNKKLQS